MNREVVIENASAEGEGAVGLAARTGAVLVDTAAFASRPVLDPRLEPAHAALVPLVGASAQPYVLVAAPGSPGARVLGPSDGTAGVRYAVPALGSATHMLLARLFDAISRPADAVFAPPETPIASTLALVERGSADLAVAPIPLAQRWFDRGALAPVAVTSARRSRKLSDTPTVGELTEVPFDVLVWYALWAAASIPVGERERLAIAIARTLREPEMVAFLEEEDAEPLDLDASELARLVAAERDEARSRFAVRPVVDDRDARP
jgi:tripartite-type tricarboxylate transporter receptor subunit TctC